MADNTWKLEFQRLVEARKANGVTIAEVADRMGLTPARVSHIETMRHVPLTTTLVRYARAVGYTTHLTFEKRP